jgi:CBS domain-containing protein
VSFTTRDVSKKAITVEPTSIMSVARDIMIRQNISRVIVDSNNTPIFRVTEKGIASYLFKNSKEQLDAISIS